ncbi:MAG: chemotaxis protein [Gammaproteobacteria bacterium]|nr:chemotaxis protein [Gammaproteobacteria bacterium]
MQQTNDVNRWASLPPILGAAAVCGVALAAALLAFARLGDAGAPGGRLALELRSLPLEAQNALRGDATSFAALRASLAQAENLRARVPAVAAAPAWPRLAASIDSVVAAREAVRNVHSASVAIRALSPQLLSQLGDLAGASGLQKLAGMGGRLERFELDARRLQQDVDALAAGVGDAAATAQRLADGLESLDQGARAMIGADVNAAAAADPRARAFDRSERSFGLAVRQAIAAAEPLAKAQTAVAALPGLASALAVTASPATSDASAPRLVPWIFASLAIALLSLVALFWAYRKALDARRTVELRVRENERNQEAIMRLLDELSSLADGDLTVQATVTEDITGAIADSINYAIEALRELVATINEGAIQLDGAMKQAQAAAGHMAKASAAQSRQISSASESMAEMAVSIEEVSGTSERCSDVARHSVDVAHKGGDAVRRTIDGMNAIRETIQETSKRIKRLGESSQEIGNIVELINDIAEQTNILALNASIQASMAGEAGRGFAVVADEVQRLAERAANATKQIEVLVRTIQTDTNEAVVSMERSTTDVVGGALLAENAGAALDEIEQVSNQIASLVQNISASARQQAAASGNISKNMQVVREISSQTADSSSATAASIAKLAALAAQLRRSVAGFRLPDTGGATTTLVGTSSTRLPSLGEPTAPRTAAPAAEASAKLRRASGYGA